MSEWFVLYLFTDILPIGIGLGINGDIGYILLDYLGGDVKIRKVCC